MVRHEGRPGPGPKLIGAGRAGVADFQLISRVARAPVERGVERVFP
ncbi:hypothetical protein STRAU_6550 [Streptomyces aurantiacus JA 4570]|uniref:Uncharacterized protein n=1 Tax=Streptomyces aurantiacus JA 4570 TaxID=1286094 RepID=S3ZCM4_9ACTN|nr:hypothetical protein STRAU_6550 [Streptomyces aurantiacus JA 4570]